LTAFLNALDVAGKGDPHTDSSVHVIRGAGRLMRSASPVKMLAERVI
jgi:hypothetical protein